MSKQSGFRCGLGSNGQHYIFAPNGRAVIRYWWLPFAQLGDGSKEYNAEFVYGKRGTICCVHGGMTRSIVKYLNSGEFKSPSDVNDLYDGQNTIRLLDQLRNKYEQRQPT